MKILATARPTAAEAQQAAFELVLWFGGLVVVLLIAMLVLIYVRRRFLRSADTPETVFTLDSIKAMRDRGDLSPEEYDTMRRKLMRLPPKEAG